MGSCVSDTEAGQLREEEGVDKEDEEEVKSEKGNGMVSFVILNYNTPQVTKQCLDSIEKICEGMEYEVIVVDNHSVDENYKALVSAIGGKHQLLRSKVNTGFGLGNMLGAQLAKGEFLCFLNSDVVLVEDCITPLVNYLTSHPDVGVITPQQYRPHGTAFAFRHKFGIRRDLLGDDLFEYLFPKRFPKRSDLTRTEPFVVSEINGSFMLFPSAVFWEIGGFDTNIFLFHEEYDIARRLEQAGYKNVVYPTVQFLHAHGASSHHEKKDIRKERFISKIYCYSKYHHPFMTFLFRAENAMKKLFSPRSWYLLPVFFRGNVLSMSMRPCIKSKKK